MRKLFLLTLTLFLFGCDPDEQDTRLICDCDYVYSDFESSECDSSGAYSVSNKSLVFNESNKKFVFDYSLFGDDEIITFDEDMIFTQSENKFIRKSSDFNRISLVYTASQQTLDEMFTDSDGNKTPLWNPTVTTFYNCRLTDGV